jgi:class 3 adenylate cyclase
MPPEEVSRLLARRYGVAAGVIDEWDGIVDKFVGDAAVCAGRCRIRMRKRREWPTTSSRGCLASRRD